MIAAQHNTRIRSGFTLVELSIVLVILGLLTGGILAGQSLIRAAELRSVTSDMSRYYTAIQAFRDKYFGLPGDITNATKFWGQDTASSCGAAPVAGDRVAKTATCDGNGDGMIAINFSTETFRAWQQLANAGLIEGSYTGVTGVDSDHDFDPGINAPKLRLGSSNGASFFWNGVAIPSDSRIWLFEGNYGNSISVGGCGSGYECIYPFLKPEEAWNIDTKIDDGKPGTGFIVSRATGGGGINCNTSVDNSAGQAAAATYMLSQTGLNCALYYKGL